jgi:hypothetical protein
METPPDFENMQEQRDQMLEQIRELRPVRAGGGCLMRSLLSLIAVIVVGSAVAVGFDYLSAPWAWGFFGKPTLVGEWVGTFTLPGGQQGAAYLNLNHPIPSYYSSGGNSTFSSNLREIRGTAESCLAAGGVQIYNVFGDAATNGKDVTMNFEANKPTVPGYALQDVRGAWGGDSLTLSGGFTTILDTADSTLSNPDDANQSQPTTIAFHKGGLADFEHACQGLGQ